MFRAISIMA